MSETGGAVAGAARVPGCAGSRGGRRTGFAQGGGQGAAGTASRAARTPPSVRTATGPDAVTAVEESNRGRIPGLTPIRVGRMAATPFAFLRGSAGLMAYDLARTPRDRHRRPDLRRRARGELRPVRGRARRPRHRPERLRRNGARAVGVGPQAARDLAGARRPGGGGGRGHLPQGGVLRGRFVPAHDAAARQAPRPGRVERHRGRGVGLAHRRPRPARHAGAGLGEGAGQHQWAVRGEVDGGRRRAAGAGSSMPRRCCGACRTRRPPRSRCRWRSI